jgi:hypothetical protein
MSFPKIFPWDAGLLVYNIRARLRVTPSPPPGLTADNSRSDHKYTSHRAGANVHAREQLRCVSRVARTMLD